MRCNNLVSEPLMKLLRLFIIALVLMVTGCGGGGGSTSTPTPPTATNGSLKIVNSSGQTITALYVTPSSNANWGANQLGTSSLPDGTNVTLSGMTAGSYDIQVVRADGTMRYQYGVSIAAGTTTTVTFSAPTATTGSLRITNNSGQSVNALYVSPITSTTWGANQLGGSTIPTGTSFTLTNIPTGAYDVMLVMADGTNRTAANVSIISGYTLVLTVNY